MIYSDFDLLYMFSHVFWPSKSIGIIRIALSLILKELEGYKVFEYTFWAYNSWLNFDIIFRSIGAPRVHCRRRIWNISSTFWFIAFLNFPCSSGIAAKLPRSRFLFWGISKKFSFHETREIIPSSTVPKFFLYDHFWAPGARLKISGLLTWPTHKIFNLNGFWRFL